MLRWLTGGFILLAVLPGTTNYKLNSYGFGSGSGTSSSSNYSIEGHSGEVVGQSSGTSNYKINSGFVGAEQANVPQIASVDNNSGIYYNKLHFVIDTQSNPTDAKYVLQVSTSSTFASNVQYVQTDGTLNSTFAGTDFQTYTAWGGGSGSVVIGLAYGTTYYFRVSATQGNYTQSPYSPIVSGATASPSITFNLTTASQSVPPFSSGLGTLTPGSVSTSGNINIGLTTNAANGANVYLNSKNSGLNSSIGSSSLASASADLSAVSTGYGAQSSSVSQTSGGPFTALSPYTGSGSVVGIVDNTNRGLYTSAGPITGGAASFLLKAKATTTSVAASDYTDILTIVAAGNF